MQIETQAPPSPQSVEPQNPQLVPRTREERERKYESLHRVFLDVQVAAPSGAAAGDLKKSDFTLFADQEPQAITSFQSMPSAAAEDPAHVIVVLDAVNNSAGRVDHFRREVEKYLKEGNGPLVYPMSIALLSDHGMELGAPFRDRAGVLRELNGLAGNLHGMSCRDTTFDKEESGPLTPPDRAPRLVCLNGLFNSSVTALNSLAEELVNHPRRVNKPNRIIVIWIGRGWPLLNERRFVPDTPEVKRRFYRNLVTLSGSLTEARVTLDAIASTELLPISPKHLQESFFFEGTADEKHVSAASLALQALAYQSGGMVLTSTRDIAGQISRCIADARSYYLLSFEYPPAAEDGQYHALEVRVDKPGLRVRTRTLYYSEK